MGKIVLSDVYAYSAIIGFYFLLLKYLLRLAKKTIDKPHPLQSIDDFVKSHGYSYDLVLVFHVYDEDDDDLTPIQLQFGLKTVVERLNAAGLETSLFYSCQRDEIYVKIRASPERLRTEADRINYKLRLHPERVRTYAQSGKKEGNQYVWKPFSIQDENQISPYDPFDYIYGAYSMNPKLQMLYMYYDHMDGHKHVLKGVDRIKLIMSIVEAKIHQQGAGLNIGNMLVNQVILAAMPLHDYDELKQLQKKWLILWDWPWNQPIDQVRDYFGERIAMYFYYLQHYVTSLMVPALLGLITYIVRVIYISPENFLMPYFTAFMVIWSSFFIEFWKRKQSIAAMKWGVSDFKSDEQDRPEFRGKPSTSPLDGKETTYFPSEEKDKRLLQVRGLISAMLVGVIAIVGGIFTFQYWISLPQNTSKLTLYGISLGSIVVSLVNAVIIAFLNKTYIGIAISLNDYENHRTSSDYENALIAKIFVFQLVNSFAALTYVSFIKYYVGVYCTKNNCISDAATTLSTVFLSNLISRAINEVVVRKIMQDRKEENETSGLLPGVRPSPIEYQYFLAEYPVLNGTLADYAGLVMQYAFTVLFVGAFPLAPFLAFVSSYIQIRIDAWKLCQAHRRPFPKSAANIGTWQDMIEILSFVGVAYNFGLIVFTSHYLKNFDWRYRWIIFLCLEHLTFGVKFLLASLIDDVPMDVDMQLKRQDFIISKVLFDEEDGAEDLDTLDEGLSTNIIILETDYDWKVATPSSSEEDSFSNLSHQE